MRKWYDITELDKYNDKQYYIIFGERSNGKSFAVQKRAIDNFFLKGEEFFICKRYSEDMKSKVCSTMLEPLYDYVLETYNHKIRFYRSTWLCYEDDGTKGLPPLSECKVMGHSGALNESDRIKGSQYPRVTSIIFEEFMSMSCKYLTDELSLFLNIVSTIVRFRTNVKVYMLGNAISKTSPYTTALGVKMHRMEKGEILEKTFTDEKGRSSNFIIQRTENVDVFDSEENKHKVVYNKFGNSGIGAMITSGDFERGEFKLEVNGVTFLENVDKIGELKHYAFLGDEHKLPIAVQYEDYYYQLYYARDKNHTFGFKEIDRKTYLSDIYVCIGINGNEEDKIHIRDIVSFSSRNKPLHRMIDLLYTSIKQNNIFFQDHDNGQDVKSALAQVNLIQK